MAQIRKGSKGSYYGSVYSESGALTSSQMQINAKYIFRFLISKGWSRNAICGMLGNMQAESSLNPGRWQSEDVGNTSLGYGLVQWTPATKYFNWCDSEGYEDPSEMDNNLNRIIYELNNGIQWIATDTYNFSFEEFAKSNESVEYLASAFLKCYERAGVEVEETRRSNALSWYEYLLNYDGLSSDSSDSSGSSGSSGKKKKKKFNFILFNRIRRFNKI